MKDNLEDFKKWWGMIPQTHTFKEPEPFDLWFAPIEKAIERELGNG